MHIDSYSFGSIQIDGKDYASDVVLLGAVVKSNWWREAGGHVYAVEDFEDVLAAAPDVVVLGTGYFGRVKVLKPGRKSSSSAPAAQWSASIAMRMRAGMSRRRCI